MNKPNRGTAMTTLFAFDDESLPGVSRLHLEMQRPKKHPGNPIVSRGRDGEPDALYL